MQDLEEEVRRFWCRGEEDKSIHEDVWRIDPRGGIVVNGAEVVEEGVSPIDPSSTLILKRGGVSEYAIEGSATGPTRSRSTPASSCCWTGLEYWSSASFYHFWYCLFGWA